jgi:hypothetical protein
MTPRAYLDKHGREHVAELCERVGTTWSYYRTVAYSGARFSGRLTRLFHDETNGELNVHDHRPDIFGPGPKRKRAA